VPLRRYLFIDKPIRVARQHTARRALSGGTPGIGVAPQKRQTSPNTRSSLQAGLVNENCNLGLAQFDSIGDGSR
jgi:hypothetical protein